MPNHKLTRLGFILAVAFARMSAQVPDGWFEWPSVEPVRGSALDLSFLNETPGADGLPRISARNGHFVSADGTRVRFWAANLAAVCAFPPTADDADLIARTLAAGGVNLVRLHHLDNPWGVGSGESIWPAGHPEHRELDAGQLDRLHRLIDALGRHGIYSNLNLKVSKSLVAADGFPESVTQIPNFQKRVDIFDRRMIDLQKDYARRLLTTRNPYTGFAPAEDPSIAIVEINNENSLVGYWTRDLGRGLDKLPEYFRHELSSLWCQWLVRHYADDAALARAWAPPAAGTTVSLVSPTALWTLVVQPGAQAKIAHGHDASVTTIDVAATDGIDWHAQVSTHGLKLSDGEVYTVEFSAKSERARKIGVGVGLDGGTGEPWRSFGLLDQVDIGPDWKTVRLVFPAHSVAGAPAALSLNAGASVGTITIKALRLFAGSAGGGLQPGQSARAGTIPIPSESSAPQWADWIHFLTDTERAFTDEMVRYLKNDLHVKAMVVCTPIDYGGMTGLNREQPMDLADGHAYWQHPDFPGGWSKVDWSIRDTPELKEFSARSFGILGDLAMVRVAGKPFTVSEFDHPAPSEFVSEMYPTVASFGCRQDWDAIYPFAIGLYGPANPDGKITDFFDQLNHPAKWGQAPFATVTFRRGLVPPAAAEARLELGSPVWAEQPHADILWHRLIPDGPLDFPNVRYAINDHPGAPGAHATLARSGPAGQPGGPVRVQKATHGPVWLVDAPASAAIVGFIGGSTLESGALRVTCERFGRDFAAVTAVALDGKPFADSARIVVTLVARASNQGIVWNEAHNSLGKNWGHGPTIAERVPAVVTINGAAGRRVYALAPNGSRRAEIAATSAGGNLTFPTRPEDRTIDYEIAPR